MELLFSLLFMLWSTTNDQASPAEFDAALLEEAVIAAREYGAEAPPEPTHDEAAGTDEWIKRDPQADTAPKIRGVYVTAHSANGSRMQDILALIESTELNSVVIDIKDDEGYVTYETGNPEIEEYGTTKRIIRDLDELMNKLEEANIYPIARIVVFKDKVLAKHKPDWSFLHSDGSIWRNNRGENFVNPYVEDIWEYNLDVAKEAVKAGFKEIQFDYVRFPEGFENRADQLIYERDDSRSRADTVTDFVEYARQQLNPLGVRVSVDIFGYAASVPFADGIGQDFNGISKYVDVISPMVYPSHYSTGWFGSTVPDAKPYTTIYGSMIDTHRKLDQIHEYKPIIRPWIQDFTASWVPGHIRYGKSEVEAQIQALYDTGVDEFLLWNASNVYTNDVDYLLEHEHDPATPAQTD